MCPPLLIVDSGSGKNKCIDIVIHIQRVKVGLSDKCIWVNSRLSDTSCDSPRQILLSHTLQVHCRVFYFIVQYIIL